MGKKNPEQIVIRIPKIILQQIDSRRYKNGIRSRNHLINIILAEWIEEQRYKIQMNGSLKECV